MREALLAQPTQNNCSNFDKLTILRNLVGVAKLPEFRRWGQLGSPHLRLHTAGTCSGLRALEAPSNHSRHDIKDLLHRMVLIQHLFLNHMGLSEWQRGGTTTPQGAHHKRQSAQPRPAPQRVCMCKATHAHGELDVNAAAGFQQQKGRGSAHGGRKGAAAGGTQALAAAAPSAEELTQRPVRKHKPTTSLLESRVLEDGGLLLSEGEVSGSSSDSR